ncbi:MAG: enoyl-CoA hydratase/isomerase family protein [Rhodocyclaceae bacterium]|jgi:enoyl-CoA hydratase/carnithine racemase|nr:enoyl-CoA hydratase/isomerase family protein [Rhodocyclaceae bacterium]
MNYETIIYEEADNHVATITLNRPEAMNSFNARMREEFRDVWRRVKENDDVHAVVLRAAPGRAFSTGLDVKEGYAQPANFWHSEDPGTALCPKANKVWKPVICAVHGMLAGGAFYWLNGADLVICSEDAEFFDPHVTYGQTAVLEPIGLRFKIPLHEVLRMVLMGNDERISAQTALRISLVSEVVELDRLWARAEEIAAGIAAKPAASMQGSVRAIWESLDATRTAALDRGMQYTQLGNPVGKAQVDRDALMKAPKKFQVR